MLKLLIAEDEALERKALRFLLERFFADSIEIVDEVTNGRDAVDKCLSLKPHIVLMDIHMPIMEGLEACSIIKRHCIEIEFIILTAFNYFDYAKKAIHMGVSDYLLKPFSNDEFINSLNKVINKINSKNLITNKNNELKENYKKISPYVEKQMVENIAYGVTLTDNQFNKYRDIFRLESVKFCCIVFRLKDKEVFNDDSIIFIKNKLNILFPSIVGGLCLNNIILFVFDEDVGSKILSRVFEKVLYDLSSDFKLRYNVNLSVGTSSTNEGLNQFYLSYKDAKRCCKNTGNKIYGSKNYEIKDIKSTSNTNVLNNVLSGRLIKEDINGAIIEMDNILSDLLCIDDSSNFLSIKKILLVMLDSVIEDISSFVGKNFKGFSKDKILEELVNLKNASDLKNCVSMILKNLVAYVSMYKKSKNIDVVEKVKNYIETNFMNDVSLDNLALYVSMSSFYLSRSFSRIEGVSIKEYIINIRMEKAKSMLIEGNKSVKQIAFDVGYVDQNYFSKAFKKYTNISPKDYCNL